MKCLTRVAAILSSLLLCSAGITGCAAPSTGAKADIQQQQAITDKLADSQSTPTDISYSLERYNLIRRAYWVNGQREKANSLVCPIEKPLGYIVLFSGNAIVNSFVVDGKVTSLNSYLTPSNVDRLDGNSNGYTTVTTEMADVDGSYGENDDGIFFFTPDGKYIEWTGEYLYSDIPFIVDSPTVRYEVTGDEK